MKRTSTLLLVLLACSLAFGAPVSKQSAQKIAEAFMNRNAASGTNRAKGRGAADQESKHAASESMDINGSLYLFNASDGNGFVIVSGDDRTAPVLGYSDTGRIDFDNMPQNMRSWLQHYVEQIEYVQNNTLSTTSGTIENVGTPIPQQLDCKWDQDAPYFDKCPISTSYYDDACTNQCVLYDKEKGKPVANPDRSLTGCAATAMAQVLYAWKGEGMAATAAEIPGQPSAIHKIYSSYAETYVYSKFSYDAIPAGTPIDWDNILPEYSMYDASLTYHVLEGPTAKQKEAVATLMHICGAALDMKYNFEGSSASLEAGINAAAKYLGFPNASACYQKCYKYNEWLKLLYDELSVARAVYFTGVKENGSGHAFVIDGYDSEDFFHINWGWSEMSNGYYRINVLDPQKQGSGGVEYNSGYKASQVFARGIYPNAPAQAPNVMVSNFNSTGKEVQYEQGEYMITDMTITVANVSHPNISAEIGVTIESQSTKDTKPLFTYNMPLGADMRTEKLTLKLGALSDGEYTCYPSFRLSADGEWTPCIGYENNCIKVTIANGIATMSNVMPYKLVTVSSDNKDVYAVGEEIKFTANLKVVEGEMHDVLYCIAEPFDEMGNLASEKYSRMDLSTNYYASAGETFAAKISRSGGLSEGSYLISVLSPSIGIHRICLIEVRNGVTAIRDIDAAAAAPSAAPAYNLQGQQVDSSYKGIIIRNGKKILR